MNRVRRALQPAAGAVIIRRWPWPLWRVRGWGMVPIGPEWFRFDEIARPEYAWWAHMARLRRWEGAVIGELVGSDVGVLCKDPARSRHPPERLPAMPPRLRITTSATAP